ncbi:hypothetical protein N7527_002701 [Penicillium freii]|nr:hypothetical protein N7527_002701 [Penicillium freii]
MGDGYSMIKVPALAVVGEKDAATPEELVTPILQKMPSCRPEVLKGVQHSLPTEAPREMERFIR